MLRCLVDLAVWLLLLLLLALVSVSRGQDDVRSYPFDSPNSMGVSSGAGDDADTGRSTTTGKNAADMAYTTTSGKAIKVFDAVADANRLELFRMASEPQISESWQFLHEDRQAGGEVQQGKASGNMPWSSRVDASWFAKTVIGRSLTGLVSGNWQRPLLPYDIRMLALRRGDDTLVNDGVSNELGEVWSVLHATYGKWKADYYGESIFYDENEEIVAACQPKFRRLVAWDASIPYLLRPPSMTYATAQYLVLIRWTTNASLVEEAERERAAYQEETRNGRESGLLTSGDRSVPDSLDVRQYETQHVVTRTTNKNVFVFDDLLNQSDVDALRVYAKRYGGFAFNDYSVGDEGSDNVQWIGSFDISKFIQSKYWKIIQRVVEYTSGGIDTWYPYDIACNVVRSTDHTRIHSDVRNNRDDEWTLLIYLSPEWNMTSYGETAWFTGHEGDDMTNDVDIETEVQPLYGRVAIFEGQIPHAARPPSSTYRGPRYSFAVKMAATQWLSSRNRMFESFHEKMDLLSSFATMVKKYKQVMKLDADDSFNGRFAKKYWKAYMAGDDGYRNELLEQAFQTTRGNGEKLNSLLNYLVGLFYSRLRQFIDEIKQTV